MFKPVLWPWAATMFPAVQKVKADAVADDLMKSDGIALTYDEAQELVQVFARAGHRIIVEASMDVLVHAKCSTTQGFTVYIGREDDSRVFAWDYAGFTQ